MILSMVGSGFERRSLPCGGCMGNAALRLIMCCIAALPAVSSAQTYPTKPIRIIVPFPAAGTADIMARVVGQKMAPAWGQQVLIDNRAGAGGNIGAELAAKAPPD